MPTRVQRKVKGLQAFSVIDRTALPGKLLVLPTPTAPELDPGITQLLGSTKSQLGETVTESVEVAAQNPLLNCTFPAVSPELLSLRYMRQLETVTGEPFSVSRTFRVTQNAYAGGVNVGDLGNGMLADQTTSIASVMGALGESTPLTRLDFAGFDPAGITDSFAQGADGAIALSDNLIGSDVNYSFPNPQAGVKLGETPIAELEINMLVAMSDLKLFQVNIPGVQTDLEGSGSIPLDGGEFSMVFRPIYNGVSCVPVTYTFIGQAIAC